MKHEKSDSNDQSQDVDKPYVVGYRRPPTRTQFKPGTSGNPRGRHKKAPTFSEVTEQILNKKIEMRNGDRVLRMTNREALVQAAVRQALAGKPRLLGILPAIIRFEAESLRGHGETDLNLDAADEAILSDFLNRSRGSETSGNGDPT